MAVVGCAAWVLGGYRFMQQAGDASVKSACAQSRWAWPSPISERCDGAFGLST